MERKIIIGFFILVAGAIGTWMASPLFYDREVRESFEEIVAQKENEESGEQPEATQPETVAQGTFAGLAGHSGEGTVSVVKAGDTYYVRFEENFRTTNGPDLFVHLGRDGEYVAEARLGNLKGNIGSQNYEVPVGIDVSQYDEVWVWCRVFSVPFASAILR